MQTRTALLALLLLTGSLLVLSPARGDDWHLAAHKKGDTVELCLSNGPQCPQTGGVSLSSISVYRWDNMHDNALVWDAGPDNPTTAGNISGLVTWGQAPKGWTNKLAPPVLVCGKAYLLNPGAHYFALTCGGAVTVFDAPQLEQFLRDNKSATPVKSDPSKDTMGLE